jgi:hypothetical protein
MNAIDEQKILDGEDAALMLMRLGALRCALEFERDEVARLTRELAAAKRRFKEAGWKLGAEERKLSEAFSSHVTAATADPPALPAPKRSRKKGGG